MDEKVHYLYQTINSFGKKMINSGSAAFLILFTLEK
jgi:hypothetical protein